MKKFLSVSLNVILATVTIALCSSSAHATTGLNDEKAQLQQRAKQMQINIIPLVRFVASSMDPNKQVVKISIPDYQFCPPQTSRMFKISRATPVESTETEKKATVSATPTKPPGIRQAPWAPRKPRAPVRQSIPEPKKLNYENSQVGTLTPAVSTVPQQRVNPAIYRSKRKLCSVLDVRSRLSCLLKFSRRIQCRIRLNSTGPKKRQ